MSRRHKPPKKRPDEGDAELSDDDRLEIDPRYVATRELFERARGKVTVEDVKRYAPNDPGYPGYVAAFEAILRNGERALRRTFDVTETIGLTRWSDAPTERDPMRFRWFRVLTCAVEILIEAPYPDHPHYGLAALLVDSFALAESGDSEAPLDLLSAICREIRPSAQRMGAEESIFCFVAELLLYRVDHLDPSSIEALCTAIDESYQRFEKWWEHESEGYTWHDEPNPKKFIWGLTHFDDLHAVWLDLIKTRFPTEPKAAAAMKERLLAGGSVWMDHRRKLS